jgi:hypothetical protein
MMRKYFTNLLFNSDLDLKLSTVSIGPTEFTVKSKIGAPRIVLGLLFGIPFLLLLSYALLLQGIYLITALVFCPPLALLCLLFGMTRQTKSFIPSSGQAIKSFQLLHIERAVAFPLPKSGTLLTSKRWSSGGEAGGGCYFYLVAIEGLEGFGFSIAKDAARRDRFARDLAEFLGYSIREQSCPWGSGADMAKGGQSG